MEQVLSLLWLSPALLRGFPAPRSSGASHHLRLPGPSPPPSGLSHPSRLSAAPTPHPPAALRPLRTSAPPAPAVCVPCLQTLPWALLDPLSRNSCRPPPEDVRKFPRAEGGGLPVTGRLDLKSSGSWVRVRANWPLGKAVDTRDPDTLSEIPLLLPGVEWYRGS